MVQRSHTAHRGFVAALNRCGFCNGKIYGRQRDAQSRSGLAIFRCGHSYHIACVPSQDTQVTCWLCHPPTKRGQRGELKMESYVGRTIASELEVCRWTCPALVSGNMELTLVNNAAVCVSACVQRAPGVFRTGPGRCGGISVQPVSRLPQGDGASLTPGSTAGLGGGGWCGRWMTMAP